jgi:hypothetical protein
MFLSANDLLEPMFRDGTLRAPAAAVNDALQRIKLVVIGNAMGRKNTDHGASDCTGWGLTPRCRLIIPADISNGIFEAGNSDALLPYLDLGLTLADVLDPWGMRYRYQPNATAINDASGGGIASGSPAASTIALRIYSQGPNRTDDAGAGDDISISVTVGEVRAYMSSLLP